VVSAVRAPRASEPAPGIDVARAYRACAAITRRRAGNFYYGIRLLPPANRRALCAVYAFARRVDDIGDGDLPAPLKLERLRAARATVGALRAGADPGDDPVAGALADALDRFRLPTASFVDLIDGVDSDVRGAAFVRFDDLVVYCRRVAGSIGRLSVAIFGAADPPRAAALADDLGVAMQLTNVLRDVVEDRSLGRVYLPSQDLERFAVAPEDLRSGSPAGAEVVRFEAARARGWFAKGLPLLGLLDRRSASCVAAMTGIYRRILARIEEDPGSVFAGRISLPAWEKGWVAARSLAGGRP